MEENQIIAETGSALGAINLQDTIQVPTETQNENLNDSLLDLSEVQLQQHLDSQTNEPDIDLDTENTETRTPLQKVMDQEGREIKDRLQKRWQDRKQEENRSDQTEEVTGKGGRQYPPTHTDYEKSKHPQTMEGRTRTKGNRELQNLGSHNRKGSEETPTETLHRRRRSIPLQTSEKDFKFYEGKADLAYDNLPFIRQDDCRRG